MMKVIGLLAISPLLAAALPSGGHASLERRQYGIDSLLELAATMFGGKPAAPIVAPEVALDGYEKRKAFKIETLPSTLKRPGVKHVRVWYGPFTVKGKSQTGRLGNSISMDPAGTAFQYQVDTDFPHNVTILKTSTHFRFENGTLADGQYGLFEHHNNFNDIDKWTRPFADCGTAAASWGVIGGPGIYNGALFMGGSEDRGDQVYSSPDGTFNSGFYINETDTIAFTGDIINHNEEARIVYLVGDMEYIEGFPEGILEAGVNILAVGMCDRISLYANTMAELADAGEKFSIKGKDMTITTDGWIVAARGHIHDGGVNIVLKVNGKEVCNSTAIYSSPENHAGSGKIATSAEAPTLETMTSCNEPIKVVRGDKLGMEAYYDFKLHPRRAQHDEMMADNMAIMNLPFAPLNPK